MAQSLAARGAPLQSGVPGVPSSLVGTQEAILPYYMNGAELTLAQNAQNAYNAMLATQGTPAQQAATTQAIMARYAPGVAQSDQLAANLSSGALTNQMLAENAPVGQARIDAAMASKNAALEQLNNQLNQIDAVQARRGFAGDSLGNRMLKFNAGSQIARQGALDLSQAKLQNAVETRATQAEGRNLQLQNMDLPDQRAQAALARTNMPATQIGANYSANLQPFSFFNVGEHNAIPAQIGAAAQAPHSSMPPLIPATPSAAQLALQSVGAAGNTVANYLLQNRAANNIAASGAAPAAAGYGNTTAFTPTSSDPAMYGYEGAG